MEKGKYGVPLERSDYLQLTRHPESCTEEEFPDWLASHASDRLAVDLFSGAGGLSFGVEQAGWTVATAVDYDERALETHAANFPGLSLHMDLGDPEERDRLVELLSRAKIDLIAGGPPCQPFSRAGRSKIRDLVLNHKRDPRDRRKELWQAYLDVVTRVRPRAVLMENVPDMGLGDDFAVVRIIEEKLEGLGYATQVRLVDAWHYGVPQHRKRLILLARNDVEKFEWSDKRNTHVSLRDAISDLPELEVEPRERIGARALPYQEKQKLSDFAAQMREGAEAGLVHDHMTRRVRKDDWEIFTDHMDSRTLYSQIPKRLQRYRADNYTDKYKKLDWDDRSRSITAHIAKDGYWYIHPREPRTLTVREAARIQTFPDRFRFAGTRSDAFRQIGNAVPPLLGKEAATAVLPVDGVRAPKGGLRPHWRLVRDDLTAWAEKARQGEDWYQFPGEEMRSPQAAVMAVLSGSKLKPMHLREIMEVTRGRKAITQRLYGTLIMKAPTEAAAAKIARLLPLVDDRNAWQPSKSHEVPERLNLGPAEERLYSLLVGDQDLLLVTQGAIRVAARLNNSDADRTNRLSDGRVNLVRVVGASDGPLRMAALRVIGSTRCTARNPYCAECPMLKHCEGKPEGVDLFHSAGDDSERTLV
ncbi:DNA (cytosine-5-)-methyltransferase [Streptomyces albidoflavus]|uniref:DNA (cytosine-5-)-methyltransferase n=1 Tax=Streptomyces albidoflavus TaxID=1886 RepID=UPI00081F6927|nr:DNA (cytosine-5-)-methyltransferase [Streptomyces albidoflavus]SCE35200.1 DNA (cytosine-5)-methyltransferase 1 [Streptomyces sp. IgraMP-1]